jgi:hypothetical protein
LAEAAVRTQAVLASVVSTTLASEGWREAVRLAQEHEAKNNGQPDREDRD